jgi:hypothetical protein
MASQRSRKDETIRVKFRPDQGAAYECTFTVSHADTGFISDQKVLEPLNLSTPNRKSTLNDFKELCRSQKYRLYVLDSNEQLTQVSIPDSDPFGTCICVRKQGDTLKVLHGLGPKVMSPHWYVVDDYQTTPPAPLICFLIKHNDWYAVQDGMFFERPVILSQTIDYIFHRVYDANNNLIRIIPFAPRYEDSYKTFVQPLLDELGLNQKTLVNAGQRLNKLSDQDLQTYAVTRDDLKVTNTWDPRTTDGVNSFVHILNAHNLLALEQVNNTQAWVIKHTAGIKGSAGDVTKEGMCHSTVFAMVDGNGNYAFCKAGPYSYLNTCAPAGQNSGDMYVRAPMGNELVTVGPEQSLLIKVLVEQNKKNPVSDRVLRSSNVRNNIPFPTEVPDKRKRRDKPVVNPVPLQPIDPVVVPEKPSNEFQPVESKKAKIDSDKPTNDFQQPPVAEYKKPSNEFQQPPVAESKKPPSNEFQQPPVESKKPPSNEFQPPVAKSEKRLDQIQPVPGVVEQRQGKSNSPVKFEQPVKQAQQPNDVQQSSKAVIVPYYHPNDSGQNVTPPVFISVSKEVRPSADTSVKGILTRNSYSGILASLLIGKLRIPFEHYWAFFNPSWAVVELPRTMNWNARVTVDWEVVAGIKKGNIQINPASVCLITCDVDVAQQTLAFSPLGRSSETSWTFVLRCQHGGEQPRDVILVRTIEPYDQNKFDRTLIRAGPVGYPVFKGELIDAIAHSFADNDPLARCLFNLSKPCPVFGQNKAPMWSQNSCFVHVVLQHLSLRLKSNRLFETEFNQLFPPQGPRNNRVCQSLSFPTLLKMYHDNRDLKVVMNMIHLFMGFETIEYGDPSNTFNYFQGFQHVGFYTMITKHAQLSQVQWGDSCKVTGAIVGHSDQGGHFELVVPIRSRRQITAYDMYNDHRKEQDPYPEQIVDMSKQIVAVFMDVRREGDDALRCVEGQPYNVPLEVKSKSKPSDPKSDSDSESDRPSEPKSDSDSESDRPSEPKSDSDSETDSPVSPSAPTDQQPAIQGLFETFKNNVSKPCLLYTSDAADDM